MSPSSKLTRLRKLVGRYAVDRLRQGKAVLNCWRGSSPHNWFITSERSRTGHLWHVGEDRRKPELDMFELVSNSKERIPHSWVHREGGSPYQSIYRLKSEYRK